MMRWIISEEYIIRYVGKPENLKKLQEQGFTVREIEILTSKSKSSVSRELKAGVVK